MSITGFAYASAVGFYGLFSREACSAFYGIHEADIYLPVFFGIFFAGFVLIAYCKVPSDVSMAKLGLEKPHDGTSRVLYKKLRKFRLTDPRFGLSLFGHIIKPGPIVLNLNSLEVTEKYARIDGAGVDPLQTSVENGEIIKKNANKRVTSARTLLSTSVSDSIRTMMEVNDEKFRGTPMEKFFESSDFVPDPWYVRVVKFLYAKDGII